MTRNRHSRKPPQAGTLGRRIYDQRRTLGMTQTDLADACGVTQSAVAKWERNETEPSVRKHPTVAGVLHLYQNILFPSSDPERASA